MRRYYDFAVRYQNVTGPESRDVSQDYRGRIAVQGVSTNPGKATDMVLPIVRAAGDYTAVNLVNLLGVASAEWKTPQPTDPKPLGQTAVRLSGITRPVEGLWMASSDGPQASLREVPFTLEAGMLSFDISSLA